jgi:serine/threonine protein kinase/WD40 repeat protein
MYVLMNCVAEAVMARGVRGLVELVPGGAFLYDVGADALRRMKDRKNAAQLRDEVMKAAGASFEEARQVAQRVAKEVAGAAPIEDRIALEMYLTQIPGAVRQSLKRADDPSGKTVPADFALNEPADLLKRLPAHMPRFRTGDLLPGKPNWQLVELLGTGGFGEVWLARNPALSALKGAVKFGLDPQARDRLLRHEGSLVSRVMEQGRHPNVVQLLDAHLEGDAPWLMYEYVPGGDLTGLIHAWQALPPVDRLTRVMAAIRTLAAAVGHFHRLGPPLVHRDLKPANVLVESTGGAGAVTLKVADFGIGGVAAASALAHDLSRRSSTGVLMSQLWGSHTPLYASPQQQRGEPPDPRDDIHALGVIAFQMLTGRLDASLGADYAKTLRRLNTPEPLIELLGDCAAHDPENRPRDAGELAALLDRLTPPAAQPRTPEPAELPRPTARPVESRKPTPFKDYDDQDDEDDRPRRRRPPARQEATVVRRVRVPWRGGLLYVGCLVGVPLIVLVVAMALGLWGRLFNGHPIFPPRPPGAEATAERLFSFDGIAGRTRDFAYSPDGNRILAVNEEGIVSLFDATDGKNVLTVETGIPGHRPAFSPDGARLVIARPDKGVRLLDTTTGKLIDELPGMEEKAATLAYSVDGRWVIAGGEGGSVLVWEATTKTKKPILLGGENGNPAHRGAVTAVTFDPKGRFLATASGSQIQLWNVAGWTGKHEELDAESPIAGLVFTPDGQWLVAGGADGRPRSWEVGKPGTTKSGAPIGAITQVAATVNQQGVKVALLDVAGDTYLWKPDIPEKPTKLEVHGFQWEIPFGRLNAVGFSPAGNLLALAGNDKTVLILEMFFVNQRLRLVGHDAVVLGVAWSPDGKRLASVDAAGKVIVWSVPKIEPGGVNRGPIEVK